MSQFKSGSLAVVKNTCRHPENRGALVELVSVYHGEVLPGHSIGYRPEPPQWVIRGIGRRLYGIADGWLEHTVARESVLKPFGDQPGNEQFVTELRNKLPRSKPATTKQDTINERGELA